MKFARLVAAVLFFLLPAMLQAAPNPDVTVSENQNSYTLANGIVTVQIARHSGDLTSLKYNGL